jgi:hypothetical protein
MKKEKRKNEVKKKKMMKSLVNFGRPTHPSLNLRRKKKNTKKKKKREIYFFFYFSFLFELVLTVNIY